MVHPRYSAEKGLQWLFQPVTGPSQAHLDDEPDKVFKKHDSLYGISVGAVFGAGPNLRHFSDVRLLDVALYKSRVDESCFGGKVLHVVGFGDDVPEQLSCLLGSVS